MEQNTTEVSGWVPCPDNNPMWAPEGALIRLVTFGDRGFDPANDDPHRRAFVMLDWSSNEWSFLNGSDGMIAANADDTRWHTGWAVGYREGKGQAERTKWHMLLIYAVFAFVLAAARIPQAVLATTTAPIEWTAAAALFVLAAGSASLAGWKLHQIKKDTHHG